MANILISNGSTFWSVNIIQIDATTVVEVGVFCVYWCLVFINAPLLLRDMPFRTSFWRTYFVYCVSQYTSVLYCDPCIAKHIVSWLFVSLHPYLGTLHPWYNAPQCNAISDSMLFFLGSQIIYKGLADIRNSSIFAHITIENTRFIQIWPYFNQSIQFRLKNKTWQAFRRLMYSVNLENISGKLRVIRHIKKKCIWPPNGHKCN